MNCLNSWNRQLKFWTIDVIGGEIESQFYEFLFFLEFRTWSIILNLVWLHPYLSHMPKKMPIKATLTLASLVMTFQELFKNFSKKLNFFQKLFEIIQKFTKTFGSYIIHSQHSKTDVLSSFSFQSPGLFFVLFFMFVFALSPPSLSWFTHDSRFCCVMCASFCCSWLLAFQTGAGIGAGMKLACTWMGKTGNLSRE